MSRYTSAQVRLFVCAVAAVVWLGVGEADSAAPGRTPAVVGVVRAGSQWTLAPLDPRTLEPVRGAWSHRLRTVTALFRSPRGTTVVASARRTIFVDTRTGRPLRRSSPLVAVSDVYWVGGERVVGRGRASIYSVYQDTGSLGGIWYQYDDLAGPDDGGATADGEPFVLPTGMLVWNDDAVEFVRWSDPHVYGEFLVVTRVNPPLMPFAADTLHDRVFASVDARTVAQIDRISRSPRVSYHPVDLNGRGLFGAAWAGQGRIAVWGQDGLATIDTLTWTTRTVDAEARAALVTPHGIVAWAYGEPGVRVYRPDGTLRFTVLEDERITPAYDDQGKRVSGSSMPVVVGRYLYIVGDKRASIDLVSGRVVGRPRRDAWVAAPTHVPIP